MFSYISSLFTDPLATLGFFLLAFPGRILAISAHEFAHAWMADKCGDPTARMYGRLTLNPLKHLDLVGTLMMLLLGFGWAKPVPVNPYNFRNYRKDDLKVSLAGITMNLILFLAGFCGALFVESITVFHICLSAAVIAYMFLKFRSFRRGHVGFLLGTLAGTWAMFSNSTYDRIATGEDYYRRMPVGLRDTVYFALDQARNILDFILSENLLFCAIVTGLLLILSVQCVKNGKKWALLPAAFHVGSLLLLLWEDAVCAAITGSFAFPKLVIHTIPIVPPVLYAFSILVVVLSLVEKGRRFGMLLPFYCAVVSLAPLLVVHPVGWRCVFIGYFFMIVFTVDLFGYVCRQMLPQEKWLSRTLGLVVMAQFVLFVNIFYPIHYYDTLRLEYIKKQAAEGKKTVLMCDLPNNEYLYDSLPGNETLAQRYQLFYGLDTDLVFEFIPCEELEKLAKENS